MAVRERLAKAIAAMRRSCYHVSVSAAASTERAPRRWNKMGAISMKTSRSRGARWRRLLSVSVIGLLPTSTCALTIRDAAYNGLADIIEAMTEELLTIILPDIGGDDGTS
jgi:hypothetical protein